MEAQAQHNNNYVGSLPSLQQGGRRKRNILNNGQTLPFCVEPTYLGTKLDRELTFCRHLKLLCKKLTSRIGVLKRLIELSWGADATVFPTATLALVHSTVEYCRPIWCRSVHTRFSGKPINDALRIVTKCYVPHPRKTFFKRVSNQLSSPQKSRTVFCSTEQSVLYRTMCLARTITARNTPEHLHVRWAEYRWSFNWRENASRLHTFIKDVNST